MSGSTITCTRCAVLQNVPLDLLFYFPKAQIIELKAIALRPPTRESMMAFRSWIARLPRASPKLLILNFSTMRSLLHASSALDLSQLVHFCAFAFPLHLEFVRYQILRYQVPKYRRIHTIEMMPGMCSNNGCGNLLKRFSMQEFRALSTLMENYFTVRVDFSPRRSVETFKFFFFCVVDPPGVPVRDAVRSFSRFLSTFDFPPTLAHPYIQIPINSTRLSNSPSFLLRIDWQPLDEQLSRIFQDRGNTTPLNISIGFTYNTGKNRMALPPLSQRGREGVHR